MFDYVIVLLYHFFSSASKEKPLKTHYKFTNAEIYMQVGAMSRKAI